MSEQPDPVWRMRLGTRVQGPFTMEQLRSKARRGELSRVHSISEDGGPWIPASGIGSLWSISDEGSSPAADDGARPVARFVRSDHRSMRQPALAMGCRPTTANACCTGLVFLCLLLPIGKDASGVMWWWNLGSGPVSLGVLIVTSTTLVIALGLILALAAGESRRRAQAMLWSSAVAVILCAVAAGLGPAAAWQSGAAAIPLMLAGFAIVDAVWSSPRALPSTLTWAIGGVIGVGSVLVAVIWMRAGALGITASLFTLAAVIVATVSDGRSGKRHIRGASSMALLGVFAGALAGLFAGCGAYSQGASRFAVLEAVKWSVCGLSFAIMAAMAYHELMSSGSSAKTTSRIQEASDGDCV